MNKQMLIDFLSDEAKRNLQKATLSEKAGLGLAASTYAARSAMFANAAYALAELTVDDTETDDIDETDDDEIVVEGELKAMVEEAAKNLADGKAKLLFCSKCHIAIDAFVKAVERRAEENMLKTGKLEGAHYAAMKAYQAELQERRAKEMRE